MINKKILFNIHFPPPTHGSSLMGKMIYDNFQSSSNYFNFLNTSFSNSDIGLMRPWKIVYFLKIFFKTLFICLKFKPAIFYYPPTTSGIAVYKDFIMCMIPKILGIKILFHLHNKSDYKTLGFLNKKLLLILFKNSNVIILSPRIYSSYKYFVKDSRIFYCNNCIEKIEFIKKKEKKKTNKINFIFISNLMYSKGIMDLINASIILKSNHSFNITIVGNDHDLSGIELIDIISKNKLTKFINFVGPKYGKEKFDILNESDILVHPTHEDCQPLVIIEALSQSMPIISTNEGCIMDMVTSKNGIIFEKKNYESLSKAMKFFINKSKLIDNYGINSKQIYNKNYSKENFINNFSKILNTI